MECGMMPVLEAVQPLAMVPAAAPHCLRWLLQMEKESQIEVAVPTVTQRLLQLYIYQPWRQRRCSANCVVPPPRRRNWR